MKKLLPILFIIISLFTLSACNPKEVTVSFIENGGNAVEDLKVIQETTIQTPDVTKEGYTFVGWFEDEGLNTPFNPDTVILRNITLYAKWTINSYTITFNFDNGNEDYIFTDDYNENIDFPDQPTKTGHEFGGWFIDEERTEDFQSTKVQSQNLTVYAYWIPNQYTVNFYLDPESETPSYSEEVLYGESVLNPPSIPLVTGMNGAWSENLDDITSDLDVYINYTKKIYTITFQDYQGVTYDSINLEFGEHINPAFTPVLEGHDFIGYYSPLLEQNIDLSTYTVESDLILIDVFKIKTFTVKFFGSEDGSLIGSVQYINYGMSATAPSSGYDRDGYTFNGWDKDFDYITEDMNIFAEYTINQYTLTLDGFGGVFSNSSETLTITADYNLLVSPSELPIREGFIFTGWYLDDDFEEEIFFGTGIPMPLNGLKVYAKWVELVATSYTISGKYYFEEQVIANDNLSITNNFTTTASIDYTPFINVLYNTQISPVREIEGYSFYKFVYNGVDYYDINQLLTVTEDVSVDVYYRRNIMTINFTEKIDNVNQTTSYYVYYNESLDNIPEPTPIAGMTVVWERQNFDNIKTNIFVAAIAYDNSLQTIIFMSNGTTIYISTNTPDLTGFIDPHNIVLTADSPLWSINQQGYRFLGWYISGTDTLIASNDIYFDDEFFAQNITTLEARWIKLDRLNEPTDISLEADVSEEKITIEFNVTPSVVGDLSIYPLDYIFILNGVQITSDLISDNSLMNYYQKDGFTFTFTFTSNNPYYNLFKVLLMSEEGDLIPGTHTLQIIGIGDLFNVLNSDVSDVYEYNIKSIYEGIPESQTVKDYYIIEDFGSGTLRYIFYTNLTYQFSNLNFKIETGSNHITADGNILRTTSLPGEFRFTITDNEGSRTYEGLVVEDIRQFSFGSDYQNFLNQVNIETEDNIFLKDTTNYPYYVGHKNTFYLDILIRNNNGEKIALDDVFLQYEFYLDGSETPIDESNLENYVSFENNVLDFTSLANNHSFRVVVEPKYEALMMNMSPLEYNIVINDGYNAFTNAQLKSLFSDLNVKQINIHRDIKAELFNNQLHADGSPRNFLATAANDYENYGNVYYRIDGNTDNDQILIEGNFMTIDGSNINYINPEMEGAGTISYAQAFDIISTQIGIFYYNVYQTSPINNNRFTMNNLRVLGNTTTPSVNYGGTEEEIYNQERLMSQNSGGMLGVVVRNGKADMNNLIIGYTTIALTTNAYGENSLGDPLTLDLDYLEIYDSWANSVYLWKGSGLKVSNSVIGSSGGAAIHFEDTTPGDSGYDDPILILENNNEINNWISGQEAWFKAYAMSSIALALKSNINNSVSDLGKSVIEVIENPVTGLETEMINLVFISLPMKGAVTYSNPNDSSSVISASEVTLDITDDNGRTVLERSWNFTEELWPINETTSIVDPRISGGQFGFALGELSDTYAFLGMIQEIKTIYYSNYQVMMSDEDAGNLAAIAGFYNLNASEALMVGGYLGAGYSVQDAVIAIKGSLEFNQPRFIEVIAPLSLTGAAGNVTVLLEIFNS
ncbi:MAG: InlB B-repeat-containing protein [Candidatus Izemoplasmatales bacterium]